MRRRRKQRGTIVIRGNRWYSRYSEPQNRNGTIKVVKVSHLLGEVIGRATKHPPGDIIALHEDHMAEVNRSRIKPEKTITLCDFIENVHLPFIEQNRRRSTFRGYRQIWNRHLKPLAGSVNIKNLECCDVQSWFDQIARQKPDLAKNTLARMRVFVIGVFKNATRLNYFSGPNPARDVLLCAHARKPKRTYAYSFQEIMHIASLLPEPAATIFVTASFSGLRRGELEGLRWEDVDLENGEIHVRRSIWNGVEYAPKHREEIDDDQETPDDPVPIIPFLADRLKLHRLRDGEPENGPVFRNSANHAIGVNNLTNRIVLPALNRCVTCGLPKRKPHVTDDKHDWQRDPRLPLWHGWHSCRRGLGTNLHALGVPDLTIQKILRHADVATTQTYYIKVRKPEGKRAMLKLGKAYVKSAGQNLPDTLRTLKPDSGAQSESVN